MFCWKALIDIVCVFFSFSSFQRLFDGFQSQLSMSLNCTKYELARFFTINQRIDSCQWWGFFSSFFPFVIFLMKCRFVYIFHSHGIAVVSRLVPLPVRLDVHNCATSSSLFFCGLWFYRQQVNETNKTRRMIALSKNRQTTNCNTSSCGDLHVI